MLAKSVLRGSIWNIVGQGVPILFALVAVPLLLKTVGEARYGFLTVVWVLIGYVGVFDFGVGKAMTRLVAERLGQDDEEGAGRVARAAMRFMLCVGLVTASVFILAADPIVRRLSLPPELQQEGVHALRILSIGMPFVMLTSGYRGALEACRQFGPLAMVRVLMGLFTYLAPLAAVMLSPRLESLVASVVLMRLLANGVHRWMFGRFSSFALGDASRWREDLRHLLSFGGWMTVSNIISPMMNSLDRLIIGTMVPVAAVGYYATAYDMVSKVLMVPYAVTGAAFPALAGMDEDARARQVYAGLFKVMALVTLPVLAGVALLAHGGFALWLGPRFAADAAPVMQILAVGLFFNCLAQAPATLILSRGAPRWMAMTHLVELPCYLALVFGLTQAYGIRGTAMAWALRAAVDALVLFVIVHRRLFSGAIAASSGALVLLLALMGFGPAFIGRATPQHGWMAAAVLSSAMVLAWQVLLSPDERRQLTGLLGRVASRSANP